MLNRTVILSRFLKSDVIARCSRIARVLFRRHLFLTNAGISMSLSGVGDVFQQHYEIIQGDKEKWDPVRTWHMSLSGLTVGVICHHWYIQLDRFIPGRSIKAVTKKVIADQILCSPVCISAIFITLGLLEKAKPQAIMEELAQKGWRLYVAEWIVWPPAQVINFYLLPTRFRVLYDNTISLGYDIYTSYVKHEIPLEVVDR
ncbi:hypothetical protein J437_LFUL009580 [Ladona fulva]|uniref:Mpv17-like protein 2 n=1 Tax=Ladona fulva TaxID=123851 RepID=A0A8K0K667_LADFU|nr:hypothetical protein J437_LFUL009580 [Ladona fulva]